MGPFFLRVPEAGVDLTKLAEWVDKKQLRTEIAEVYSHPAIKVANKKKKGLKESKGSQQICI